MTFEKLLKVAEQKATQYHKEIEAVKLLLMELSKQDPHQFFLNLKKEVDTSFEKQFLEALEQYIRFDIPVQHIIGHAYFYGYPFTVNSNVLIPRAETEQLVEHILVFYDAYFQNQKIDVLDLGTGSGCIGLTLALEESHMNVTVSDISLEALEVTKENQKKLGANAQIIHSDLFENIHQTFDIIVSNPPYIPDSEIVQSEVTKEPSVALYGGSLGVDFYDRILKAAKDHIKTNGLIAFEHGYQQNEAIHQFATTHFPNATILQIKDLAGKDRFTFIGLGTILNNEPQSL